MITKLIVRTINSSLQKSGINIGSFLKHKIHNNNKFSQNYYILQNSYCICACTGDRTGYVDDQQLGNPHVSVT
jgi:hypothetical protein